ncbi:fused MFS/spermidine synthase [Methylobacterium indicum]|uniref:fused MFS/spermidine synthase n=1 Tax=Methylobacterium indicum TaxID=1775910 RepID=UPI00069FBE92|nr:fused MFS/spermidine synthase [Methylobacterium indicum]
MSIDLPTSAIPPATAAVPRSGPFLVRLQVPAAAIALLLSAFLLFSVQPMFTKMVLPRLGGSPATWSVALVVFQALLLGGYLYAHLLARHLGTRAALAVHLGLMLVAALALPIGLPAGFDRPPGENEALWLVGLFTTAVGLPFFALSANGPLLQAWFARSGHPRAGDPYFLYAASNVGSFAALLAYPLLIEPLLTLRVQAEAWVAGFAVLGLLILASGLASGAVLPASPGTPAPALASPAPGWPRRWAWIGFAFVPSALLVSVTAHISTDVAAAPLLWVAPLALFLLTFVIAFRDGMGRPGPALLRLQVWGTALALASFVVGVGLWGGLALHLGLFFVSALIGHATLYHLRPASDRLTEFYVCVSLGGVLGGIACGLVAPLVFSRVVEYPLLIVAALACRPGFAAGGRASLVRAAQGGLAAMAAAALMVLAGWSLGVSALPQLLALAGAGLLAASWRDPQRLAVAALLALVAGLSVMRADAAVSMRSFFGIHRIAETPDGTMRLLMHGTTIHGAMRLVNPDGTAPDGPPEPLVYYTPEGPLGTAIRSVRAARGGSLGAVAVVGLGTGSLACHRVGDEAWRFYEIDPAVARIARDPEKFRFLSACGPDMPVVLGDARLTLAEAPGGENPGGFGLLMIDAFSSDAIPAHLLTREALALYLAKLSPTGVLAMHITNRHLDLGRIVARVGAEFGLSTFVAREAFAFDPVRFRAAGTVAVLARDPAHLGTLAADPAWERIAPDRARRPWTDDFSNILQAMADKRALPRRSND